MSLVKIFHVTDELKACLRYVTDLKFDIIEKNQLWIFKLGLYRHKKCGKWSEPQMQTK